MAARRACVYNYFERCIREWHQCSVHYRLIYDPLRRHGASSTVHMGWGRPQLERQRRRSTHLEHRVDPDTDQGQDVQEDYGKRSALQQPDTLLQLRRKLRHYTLRRERSMVGRVDERSDMDIVRRTYRKCQRV